MRSFVKHVGCLGLIFLMLICFAFSAGYSQKVEDSKDVEMVYLEDTSLKASAVWEFQKEEQKNASPVSFCGWVQRNDQDLYYKEFNRHTSADVLYLCGDSTLVIDSTAVLKADDGEGALISAQAAYELFGSTDVTGQVLLLGSRKLTIRGLIKSNQNKEEEIAVQAVEAQQTGAENSTQPIGTPENQTGTKALGGGPPQNQTFSNTSTGEENIAIRAIAIDTAGMDKAERNEAIEAFTGKYGIKGENADFKLYKDFAGFFSMILPMCIIILSALTFLKKGKQEKERPVIYLLYWTSAIFTFMVGWKLCGFHLSIPKSMIPNQWSDFEFWQKLFQDYVKEVRQLSYIMKQKPELNLLLPVEKTVMFSLLGVALFFISNTRLRINSLSGLWALLAIVLVIEYVMILYLNTKELLPQNILMLWLLYPYYLVGSAAAKKIGCCMTGVS